jgi:hypothetical protein
MRKQAEVNYEPLSLIELVWEIAEASSSPEPRLISQRAWDSARAGVNPNAPVARSISARLRLSWKKVLEIAFWTEPRRAIALGHAMGEDQQDWLTPQYVSFSLNLAARRRGKPTITPGEYEQERASLLEQDRAHWLHGGRLKLPNTNQIVTAAGDWDEALSAAGLNDSLSPGYRRDNEIPTIPEILERCYEAHEAEPTVKECEVFAQANSIPFPNRRRLWASYLDDWKQQRLERGLASPNGPPPLSERPDYSRDMGARREGERRRKRRDDFDEAVEWVARYLTQLRPGETASQRSYGRWAGTQDGAIYPSTIRLRHGSWVPVRDAAKARLRTALDPGLQR